MTDDEANRLSARAGRYARVGVNVGGAAARMAGQRLFAGEEAATRSAAILASALGGLKGPIMKVAQLLATIPDAVPPEYADALRKLQSDAPPMGWPFVKRRMMTELGADWEQKFKEFDRTPAAAASLGQVHRATAHDGRALACKLQYPDMASAVEADISQLRFAFSVHRRFDKAIDTREIIEEIGTRVREELDYAREAKHVALYRDMLKYEPRVRVPEVVADLSTKRLLTLTWLDGRKILDYRDADPDTRNTIAQALFAPWWGPFSRFGVIHGDPHLGNYTVFEDKGRVGGINLLDYGCIRVFPPVFVEGVVELYRGLLENDEARVVSAYERWGFKGLSRELIDILNIWARFIYGPLLEDRVRTVADGVSPAEYGRRQAFQVHKGLREKGPVTVPRAFVFMDRAAIGLGGAFLHLGAELNFYRLFNEAIDGFDVNALAQRQRDALERAGLNKPEE